MRQWTGKCMREQKNFFMREAMNGMRYPIMQKRALPAAIISAIGTACRILVWDWGASSYYDNARFSNEISMKNIWSIPLFRFRSVRIIM